MWSYKYVKEMLAAYRKAKEITVKGGTVRMFWSNPVLDAEGFRKEFIGALNRRINLKGGIVERGWKFGDRWQTDMLRDSRILHEIISKRIRHYQFNTKEMRQRFGHLLSNYED